MTSDRPDFSDIGHQVYISALNGLDDRVVVVDRTGRIVWVNQAWVTYAEEQGAPVSEAGIGADYLQTYRESSARGTAVAADVLAGITDVIEGRCPQFSLEYPFQGSGHARWHRIKAVPLKGVNQGLYLVVHCDISREIQTDFLLRHAIGGLGAGFTLWNAEGRLVYYNDQYLRFAQGAEDVLRPGLVYRDYLKVLAARGLRKEAVGQEEAWIERRLGQRRNLMGYRQDEAQLADGSWVGSHQFRSPDGGVIAFAVDIDNVKKAEAALHESETRLRLLADNMPGALFRRVLTPDGRNILQYISSGAQQLFGVPSESVIQDFDAFLSRVHPEDRDAYLQTIRNSARTLTPVNTEFRMVTDGGNIKWLRSVSNPRATESGYVIWEGIVLDITRERQLNEQLMHASKLATLGGIVSGIAHEISQPLSILGMISETLAMDIEDGSIALEQLPSKFEIISEQKRRISEIIEHLLVFGRRSPGETVVFRAEDAVRAAVEMVQPDIRADGIELVLERPRNVPQVWGLSVQLEQVVLNLIHNARDALREMDAKHPGEFQPEIRVEIRVHRSPGTVDILVSDNGAGVPPELMDKIFDPFFTTKPVGEGTGLGLSISRQIVESWGGSITAENAAGGSVFKVSLPIAAGAVKDAGRVAAAPELADSAARIEAGRKLRVLVVDDEIEIIRHVEEYLERRGYTVVATTDAASAIALNATEPVDIVLTDYRMPRMNGEELIRALREKSPQLPAIIMTGHFDISSGRAIETETSCVLMKKPISLKELAYTINLLA